MRRDQLEHAVRTACQILGKPAVIVVGSQSILGTYREEQLPAAAFPATGRKDRSRAGRTHARAARAPDLPLTAGAEEVRCRRTRLAGLGSCAAGSNRETRPGRGGGNGEQEPG